MVKWEIMKRSNGKRFALTATKNGRKRSYTLVEVDFKDLSDDSIYRGFTLLGSKGGFRKSFRYIGESVYLAVQAVEIQFEVVVMKYQEVFQ